MTMEGNLMTSVGPFHAAHHAEVPALSSSAYSFSQSRRNQVGRVVHIRRLDRVHLPHLQADHGAPDSNTSSESQAREEA